MDYKSLQRRLNLQHNGIVWPDGFANARVLFLGHRPETEDERLPFTRGGQMYLRHVIGHMVPRELQRVLSFGYVNPLYAEDSIKRDAVWGDTTRTIVRDHLKPKSVVLLGLEAYNAFFFGSNTNIEQLRRTRIGDVTIPQTNFFVTHAPADVVSKEEAGDESLGRQFWDDLRAVFSVQPTYYMKTRVVGKGKTDAPRITDDTSDD
jgi:hypothetical protein